MKGERMRNPISLPRVSHKSAFSSSPHQKYGLTGRLRPLYWIQKTYQEWRMRMRRTSLLATVLTIGLLLLSVLAWLGVPLFIGPWPGIPETQRDVPATVGRVSSSSSFDPSIGAVLPTHRIIAFYAVPHAPATGPAYELTTAMLERLQAQGAAYQRLDPAHPVRLGIDLVASVPDAFPGPQGTYSHLLDAATIQSYLDFCSKHGLLLFLDLNFGQASISGTLKAFLPYLERYPFVHLAIDPEWMFPRHDGIPGINLSNVRAADLNPIIRTLARLPLTYHMPRKILLIHQYRPDGDGLSDPYDSGQAEIADKRDLLDDPRVDVVIHVDSVGGYPGDQADKTQQYNSWVGQDIRRYHKFRYGGLKLFYQIEAKTGLMTPRQVLALNPPPMVITYGN